MSFATATTVEDAVEALAAGARPVAGGTDLVVGARQGKAPLPESIVAIHRVAELAGITEADGGLRLGALTSHAEIASHPVVAGTFSRWGHLILPVVLIAVGTTILIEGAVFAR